MYQKQIQSVVGRLLVQRLFFVILLLQAPVVLAEVIHCVGTTSELNAALSEAESNGDDDFIKIRRGTYNGTFQYYSAESHNLIDRESARLCR